MPPETTRHDSTLGAIFAGVVDLFGGGGDGVVLGDERLDGRTVLVTGASRGLGLGISKGLAGLGARVIMACRSRGDEAVAEVKAASGSQAVASVWVDLAEPGAVDALADALQGERLDRVVCNAGVVPASSRQTGAGLDVMFHVNFLANVQLLGRLLADGTVAPDAGDPPRIVIVGSEAHRSSEPIDFDHFGEPATYGTGGVMAAYGMSKLHLHTYAVELGRRLDGVHVHHLCPGAVASSIAREAPAGLGVVVKPLMRLLFQSPDQAAGPVLYLVASDALTETGTYLHLRTPKDPSELALDAAHGRRLWDEAHALVDHIRS